MEEQLIIRQIDGADEMLTPEQELIVEEELVEVFAHCQDEIAVELGIKRQPDTHDWSEEDAQRIFDEVGRQFRRLIADRFAQETTNIGAN